MSRYTFGPFLLDPEARILERDGELVPMAGKTLDTLLLLVQNRGRLVDKDELLSRVWAGSVVEEANLTQSIFTVRKILGDNPKDHRYIATVAGRGYQFVAPVTELTEATPPGGGIVHAVPHEPSPGARIIGTLLKRHKGIAFGGAAVAVALITLIGLALRRLPKPAPELTQRRLTFNSSANAVASAAISPDGNYLAYSDPAGIHVKLLSTGEERLIPTPGGMPAGALSYVDSWFPDGTQLLAHSKLADDHASMWTVSVMGQSPSELRGDALGWAVSPDGRRIAFSPSQPFDNLREIWLMDAQGDNPKRIVGRAANEWLWSVQWSPDGRRLAYIRAQHLPDKYFQFIETCDLKGADRRAVVVVSGSDPWVQDMAWLSDGRIIYSRLATHGSSDANLWQVGVNTKRGTPASRPIRITNWAESNLVGLSASGTGKRIVLQRATHGVHVLLGELGTGGMLTGFPSRLTKDEANDVAWAWTTDGKAVIIGSNRDGRPHLFKQSISDDLTEPLVTGPKTAGLARLSPDGTWVLYMENSWSAADEPAAPSRLMRVPVNGGLPQFVLETRNWWGDFQCGRAPASLCVICELDEDQNRIILTAFDPVKGRGKLLKTIEVDRNALGYATGMSPDGLTFAIAKQGEADIHIRLLSLSGGSDREITVRGWPNISGLDWSADGKGFYCGSTSPEGATLLYVSLKGTAQTLWRNRVANASVVGVSSPDGRYLAIWARVRNSNVWLVEGF